MDNDERVAATQVYPRAIPAPPWARYLIAWPHGLSYTTTAEDAAKVCLASGRSDHHVVRVVDGTWVWPYLNPRMPRGRS